MKTIQAAKQLVKAIKSDVIKLSSKANAVLKNYFAPYIIVDNHGTNVLCWTMKEAQAWFPYCSKSAYIMETYDYTVIIRRIQNV